MIIPEFSMLFFHAFSIFDAAKTALKCDDQIHSLKLLLVRLLKLVLYYSI